MFKTKLQEVCHRKKWGLPKYSCIKDGADHYPQFRASVSVNGLSFDSLTASNSSKHALNDAAKLAFLHFTSDAKPIAAGPEIEETDMSSQIHSNASDVKAGIQYQYKMQLQSFAQAKNLDLPLYSSKREGKPHALQFQATVTIDGHSFESPGYFRTLKEAEHAAAKVALMSLSLDGFQEIDTHFYKNLLQELAQKEGFTLPEFQTVKCGLPHKPTFFSNVELEGEIFQGKGAKSKKLAEQSAAKVACTVFTERKSTRGGDLSSSGSSAGEMLKCSPSGLDLLTNANPQQSLKPLCSMGSSPAKENEGEEIVSTRDFPVRTKVSLQDTTIASPALLNTEEAQSSSARPPPLDLSALSITASNKQKKTEETKSYLLSNRVRVYTCIPNIAFPEGTVLLPIADCKWVAVSLEFPNEKN
ncbi:unnamed protein product [Camellia sinensis]